MAQILLKIVCTCTSTTTKSVSRFGEILPLRQISKVIGNILGFNLISANNANFYVIGEIFIVENGRSLSI